jgi:PAS domain S-box-containing protein
MVRTGSAESFVETAVAAVRSGNGYKAVLDEIPVPVYVTDAEGAVTYWNQACVEFAGREPQLGHDRWCVTWQLHTMQGDPLPHDQCPMAVAIKERREVRNAVAIALRPDGSRSAFTPYPTPLFDDDGKLTGAVNILIDVSAEQAAALGEQAARCRRLALATHDRDAAEVLTSMAAVYEETRTALRSGQEQTVLQVKPTAE